MRLARLAMAAVCAVGATGIAALGAEPNRTPPHVNKEGNNPGASAPTSRPTRFDKSERPGRIDFRPISPEDWANAKAFLEKHSPRRAELVLKMAEENPGRSPWGRQIVTRWREMKQLETSDRPMYDIKLAQMEAEDKMFGEALAIRQQTGSAEEHKKNLYEFGRQFVEYRIQERKLLVAKLQAAIDADNNDLAGAVKARVQLELNAVNGDHGGTLPTSEHFDSTAKPSSAE